MITLLINESSFACNAQEEEKNLTPDEKEYMRWRKVYDLTTPKTKRIAKDLNDLAFGQSWTEVAKYIEDRLPLISQSYQLAGEYMANANLNMMMIDDNPQLREKFDQSLIPVELDVTGKLEFKEKYVKVVNRLINTANGVIIFKNIPKIKPLLADSGKVSILSGIPRAQRAIDTINEETRALESFLKYYKISANCSRENRVLHEKSHQLFRQLFKNNKLFDDLY